MNKYLVYYYGEPHIVEAESFEDALYDFWKYPEGVTMIALLPKEETE